MIKAVLENGTITIMADPDDAHAASMLLGATRNAKMPPCTWKMPFTLEAIGQLRKARVLVSAELADAARQRIAAHRYVEQVKLQDRVKPLAPIPVRDGVELYNHQVKGYNIALALFGYEPPTEEVT